MTIAIKVPVRPVISRTSEGAYRLTQTMQVLKPLQEVFEFFSDARNLNLITPPWLQFKILTEGDIDMREGTLLDYRLKLHGVPVRWTSEITIWDPPRLFVDTQARGPYKEWHHLHRLTAIGSSTTEVSDQVDYKVPGGRLINRLFVKRDLEAIFKCRAERSVELLRGTP